MLGLGNDLLADDAVGILTARALRKELKGQAEVVESSLHGLALLDYFLGFHRAIVIDAVRTGKDQPGTIYELTADDLSAVLAPSPHYSGFPEMLALAREMNLDFPHQLKIFALEVADLSTIGGKLSQPAEEGIKELSTRVKLQLQKWQEADRNA